jgi:RNA 3'-terminal phosphate cyclase (ATP)
MDIALRELKVVGRKLSLEVDPPNVVFVKDPVGPGNVVFVELASEQVTEVFTGFGQPNVRAEAVAEKVSGEVRRYLAADVPVGEHLADQLLVLIATAGGKFRTVEPTRHTTTNIEVIKAFVPVEIVTTCVDEKKAAWEIEVRRL